MALAYRCPRCGGPLVDILVLDGRDERLRFLGIDGLITATCCPNCVCYMEAAYCHFTLEGESKPLAAELLLSAAGERRAVVIRHSPGIGTDRAAAGKGA